MTKYYTPLFIHIIVCAFFPVPRRGEDLPILLAISKNQALVPRIDHKVVSFCILNCNLSWFSSCENLIKAGEDKGRLCQKYVNCPVGYLTDLSPMRTSKFK